MTDVDEAGWDDADRAVQIEDDNPEALAGAEVEFDEADEADEPYDGSPVDDEPPVELHDRLAVGDVAEGA